MQYFFSTLKTHSIDFNLLKKLGLVVLFVFVLRYIVSVITYYFLPTYSLATSSFNLPNHMTETKPHVALYTLWNKWDSNWYLDIAKNGYEKAPFRADVFENWGFHPFFPYVVRFISIPFGINANGALHFIGVVVSCIFLTFGLYVFYKLLEHLNFSRAKIHFTLILFLAFPSNYFFTLNYGESLYFFLSILSMYVLFKQKYLLSAVFVSLSLVTRISGIALLPGLCVYIFYNRKSTFVKNLLFVLMVIVITAIPTALHYLYLYQINGEFFSYFKILNNAWAHEQNFPFIFFTTFFVYMGNFTYVVMYGLIFIMLLAFLILLIFSVRFLKHSEVIGEEYTVLIFYALASFTTISGINTGVSILRYIAPVFPIYILVTKLYKKATLQNPYMVAVFALFVFLQSLLLTLFVLQVPTKYSY